MSPRFESLGEPVATKPFHQYILRHEAFLEFIQMHEADEFCDDISENETTVQLMERFRPRDERRAKRGHGKVRMPRYSPEGDSMHLLSSGRLRTSMEIAASNDRTLSRLASIVADEETPLSFEALMGAFRSVVEETIARHRIWAIALGYALSEEQILTNLCFRSGLPKLSNTQASLALLTMHHALARVLRYDRRWQDWLLVEAAFFLLDSQIAECLDTSESTVQKRFAQLDTRENERDRIHQQAVRALPNRLALLAYQYHTEHPHHVYSDLGLHPLCTPNNMILFSKGRLSGLTPQKI